MSAKELRLQERWMARMPSAIGDGSREEGPFTVTSRTGTVYALLLLSALVVILYAPVLVSLAQQWWSDPNYGHGLSSRVLRPMCCGAHDS